MKSEKYHLTEHGIAIHEQYAITLLSAEEAVRMANWLLWHYVRLVEMAAEQERKREEREHP